MSPIMYQTKVHGTPRGTPTWGKHCVSSYFDHATNYTTLCRLGDKIMFYLLINAFH